MKFWIDILTPKQVLFFSELSRRLEAEGHEVYRTTRLYREVNQVLRLKGVKAFVVGRHGGPSLEGKLKASLTRSLKLIEAVDRWKPDAAISFASPEAARVAFGLKIPHFCVSDSPHAEATAKLAIPLSVKLFTSKFIPIERWVKLGVNPKIVVQYNSLDPVAWLRSFKPSKDVLRVLKLDLNIPIIVARPEAAYASYLLGKASIEDSVITFILQKIIEASPKIQTILLPRYVKQRDAFKKKLGGRVKIPRRAIDATSLLAYSTLFIGAGGTMSLEAALLGVPTISCLPLETMDAERPLIERGLLYRASGQAAVDLAIKILSNLDEKEKCREKAKELLKEMEDPIDVIIEKVRMSTTNP